VEPPLDLVALKGQLLANGYSPDMVEALTFKNVAAPAAVQSPPKEPTQLAAAKKDMMAKRGKLMTLKLQHKQAVDKTCKDHQLLMQQIEKTHALVEAIPESIRLYEEAKAKLKEVEDNVQSDLQNKQEHVDTLGATIDTEFHTYTAGMQSLQTTMEKSIGEKPVINQFDDLEYVVEGMDEDYQYNGDAVEDGANVYGPAEPMDSSEQVVGPVKALASNALDDSEENFVKKQKNIHVQPRVKKSDMSYAQVTKAAHEAQRAMAEASASRGQSSG
jgi:hypothetical protein